jgi:polar amino acid transport system permease protein/polar amino acid transport system substrate-binding protein
MNRSVCVSKKRTHTCINILLGAMAFGILLLAALHFQDIWQAFKTAIITNRAYVGILGALRITAMLTIAGTFLGTIFGSLLCFMRMSKIASLKILGQLLIAVLRGTPVVMLLMFLYFIVFAGNSLDAMYVAMLGYGMNAGANMAEIFYTSIEAINPKEIEAARMLGFSKIQAFLSIVLPQSCKIARPVYENSIIALLQWTSVAGYISVTELTRIINGLGTRTGNPFFSLFLGIVFYLALAYLVRFIFWITGKKGYGDD